MVEDGTQLPIDSESLANLEQPPIKKSVFEEAKKLAGLNPNLFASGDFSNDYYILGANASTLINSDKKTYILSMGLFLPSKGDFATQDLRLINEKHTIYRLDVTTGQLAIDNYQRIQQIRKNFPDSDLADLFIRENFNIGTDGQITEYSSRYAETEISDEEALQILINTSSLEIPPNLKNCPTLEDALKIIKNKHPRMKLLFGR